MHCAGSNHRLTQLPQSTLKAYSPTSIKGRLISPHPLPTNKHTNGTASLAAICESLAEAASVASRPGFKTDVNNQSNLLRPSGSAALATAVRHVKTKWRIRKECKRLRLNSDRIKGIVPLSIGDYRALTRLGPEYSPEHPAWRNSIAMCICIRDEKLSDIREWLAYYRCGLFFPVSACRIQTDDP